ncbi:MFS quinate transporter [Colletotrichum karsti]|uniref:MFS quinate transporter n=1 Tax=Colletotrichum karsti TaxID=1095194 RepID=A0A9P6IFZ7_9PEZI|nr:MFS quinate transporter [Colletotrichum karsti]KAF9878050.1 MFS quinate transporter [Colletotrichum karsti]
MDAFKKSSLAKYVSGVKTLPAGIFNWHLSVTVTAFALGGCPKGWDEGAAASITELESFKTSYHLHGSNSKTTISNLVSFVNIGAGVGAFLSFFLNDKIGRIWSMRLYQVVYAAGSMISCFSYGNHGVLYVGRIVAGLGIGALTVVGPMAIAEMAPKSIRGLMTLWFNVCMLEGQALGIFTVFGCNTNISSERSLQYQIPWFVQTFAPAISVGLSFFAVESPRWLAIKGKQKEALDALMTLRGLPADHPYLEEEYALIETHLDDENQQAGDRGYWSIMKETLTVRSNLRRVQLAIVAYILAQFSGANSVTNYLPTIFGYIGIQGTGVKVYSSGIYAVAKMICCLVASLVFVDVLGRRKSLMIGITIQAACHAYLSGYLRYFIKDPGSVPTGASDAAIGIIYIHALGWAVGLYTLPYLFGAELWPNRIRSFGGALSQGFHWIFYFAITKATPSILSSMDVWGAFLFFVGWCILAFMYTLFFIPETSGLSLDEMDAIFERPMHQMRRAAVQKGDEEDIRTRRVSVEKEVVSHIERH